MVYCKGRNPVEVYLKIFHPKIRKRKHSSISRGYGWVYYDSTTNQELFKYTTGGPVVKTETGFKNYYPVRLSVDRKLCESMFISITNFEGYLKKWFNGKYNLEYEQLINFID